MPNSPYIAGDGALRQRSLSAGDGTSINPDIADFAPKYLNDSPITGTALPSGGAGVIGWLSSIFSNLGTTSDTAATSDTGTFSLVSLFKRSLQSLTSLTTLLSRPSILYVTGTIATTGDNTIVVAPGSGLSIYVTHILIQNESATSTTVIVKDTANRIRFLAQTQGALFSAIFPGRREIKLTANTALILNLSGANSIGYSIGYYTAA